MDMLQLGGMLHIIQDIIQDIILDLLSISGNLVDILDIIMHLLNMSGAIEPTDPNIPPILHLSFVDAGSMSSEAEQDSGNSALLHGDNRE